MNPEDLSPIFTGTNFILFNIVFWFFIAWCMVWKGIALWKAARYSDRTWFIIMLVLNTIGILEILYIYVFSKKHKK